MKGFFQWLFFGNIFLGLCAVALSVETCFQLNLPINKLLQLLTFLATLFYYNIAYISEKPPKATNERNEWYFKHHKALLNIQLVIGLSILIATFLFLRNIQEGLLHQKIETLLFLSVFPITALLYYGIHPRSFKFFKLRDIGWLKPFLIGFSWAGMVNVFPIVVDACEKRSLFFISKEVMLLFGINWLLCSVIALLFDIKDYTTDYNVQLKTLVVKRGLKYTLWLGVLPLCLIVVFLEMLLGWAQQRLIWQMLLSFLPIMLLTLLAFTLQKRKDIFYYLLVIDGIALVKAICGILICLSA